MVDPHVHLRDWNQAEKETFAHGFLVAWRAGISAVFEMPNTDPPLTTRDRLARRRDEADAALKNLGLPISHGMYASLTGNPNQIGEIVRAYNELYPRVVGLKLFAGHSTGRIGVTEAAAQFTVWKTLAHFGYRGVVAVHAESEMLLRPELWDPARPESHSDARPPLAEVTSVQTQLALAEAAGFRGHLHLCHVSVGDTIRLVRAQRAGLPFAVSLGVTPHHALLAKEVCRESTLPEWNVNPPLRAEPNRARIRAALASGDVDWIESDHAPHTLTDKAGGSSGLPGFPAYRLLVEILKREGVGSAHLRRLTVTNACAAFGIDPADLAENANGRFDYGELAREYPHDPYRFLTARLRLPTSGPFRYARSKP